MRKNFCTSLQIFAIGVNSQGPYAMWIASDKTAKFRLGDDARDLEDGSLGPFPQSYRAYGLASLLAVLKGNLKAELAANS